MEQEKVTVARGRLLAKEKQSRSASQVVLARGNTLQVIRIGIRYGNAHGILQGDLLTGHHVIIRTVELVVGIAPKHVVHADFGFLHELTAAHSYRRIAIAPAAVRHPPAITRHDGIDSLVGHVCMAEDGTEERAGLLVCL